MNSAAARSRGSSGVWDARLAVEARGLRKSYGDTAVLDGVDLRVPLGTVFALLGSAGSGKTTLVRILSARTAADDGSARIAGHDLGRDADAVRAAVGVSERSAAVDSLLTAEENLFLMSGSLGVAHHEGKRLAAELLRRLEVSDVAGRPAAGLSSGMRRRLGLAMALMGSPGVVLLDEPMNGLDPHSRRVVGDFIRDLVADGVTVLLTTRSPQEAGQLADRIAVLDRGRIVAEGTAADLKRLVPGGHIRLHFEDRTELDAAAALFRLHTAVRDDEALSLQIPGDGSVTLLRAVLDLLEDAAVEPLRLTLHTPGLDDVFTVLTEDAPHGWDGRRTTPAGPRPGTTRKPPSLKGDRLGHTLPLPLTALPLALSPVLLPLFGYVADGLRDRGLGSRADHLTVALLVALAPALLVGFRPDARLAEWCAATGLLALTAAACAWFATGAGGVLALVWGAGLGAVALLPVTYRSSPRLDAG